MKKTSFLIGVILLIIIIVVVYSYNKKSEVTTVTVTSFESCASAGYPIMESYPRQCRALDGKTYVEEIPEKITYTNASADLITVTLPFPGAVVGREFSITGSARGTWYFEASFPVTILDKDGAILLQVPVQAQSDWMTTEFVPYKVDIKIPGTYTGPATIVLHKDNPSGMPQRDASISFPVTIE